MTWNELIYRLNEIPESRREEKAIFMEGFSDNHWEIDDLDQKAADEIDIHDENFPNETISTKFILSP